MASERHERSRGTDGRDEISGLGCGEEEGDREASQCFQWREFNPDEDKGSCLSFDIF